MLASIIANVFSSGSKVYDPEDFLLEFGTAEKKRLTTAELVAKGERIAAKLVSQGKAKYGDNDRETGSNA